MSLALSVVFASGLALANPCADERVLGRGPVGVPVAAARLDVTLVLARELFDGLPMVGAADVHVKWTLPTAPAATWVVSGRPGVVPTISSGGGWSLTAAPLGWTARQCEQGAPADHQQAVVASTGPLTVLWALGATPECRLRVPLDGSWAPGAKLTITVQTTGVAPPMPIQPSLPKSAVVAEGGWTMVNPQGDLVIDIPGCG